MKLVVERLSDAPQRFEFERSAQWWEERVGGAAHPEGELLAPFRFVLDANTIGSKLFLRGSAARRNPGGMRSLSRALLSRASV